MTCNRSYHRLARVSLLLRKAFFKNILFFFLLLGLVGGGVFGTSQVAQADPHGVFYTAIGQKQLFFNVLAALDQADYVEYEYERQDRLDNRADVEANPPFESEEFELLDVTSINEEDGSASETGSPGGADLLSRSITLEGNDLYNDQLIREYGAEFSRRNAMSELTRVLCEYGLGIPECDEDLLDLSGMSVEEAQAAKDKITSTTFVKDINSWNVWPFVYGAIPAAMSGYYTVKDNIIPGMPPVTTEVDKKNRVEGLKKMKEEEQNKFGLVGAPFAYSNLIASWRKELQEDTSESAQWKYDALEKLIKNVLYEQSSIAEVPDNPYKGIKIDPVSNELMADLPEPGSVEYYESSNIDNLLTISNNVLLAPDLIRRQLVAATERVKKQQEMIEDEGLLTDTKPIADGSNNDPREISLGVKKPVAVREAKIYSLPVNLGLLDTSQRASSLKGIDEPGSFQLVDREEASSGNTEELVAGAFTGQVLGALDLFDRNGPTPPRFNYDKERDPTSPSANVIAGHLEQGAVHALRQITGGLFRKDAGGAGGAGGAGCGGMTGC